MPIDYLTVKWLHVVSSTVLFGTGIGSAYYLLCASMHRDARGVLLVVRYVVIADWIFTTPSIIFQPISGFYLASLAGFPLSSSWMAWSLVLYVVAGVCWLSVVWMQIQMRELARMATASAEPLPRRYWIYFRAWVALGVIAFASLIAVFYLMVAKPLF
jgi:uncharacterized membrane protein